MIKLRNLEKAVKTKAGFTYLLRQINLDIAEGEFVTIMGPSGAGKSTLLSIIGFYDSAWEGEYYLFDQAVHKLAPKERAALNKRDLISAAIPLRRRSSRFFRFAIGGLAHATTDTLS